jgi:hypothetical protein
MQAILRNIQHLQVFAVSVENRGLLYQAYFMGNWELLPTVDELFYLSVHAPPRRFQS